MFERYTERARRVIFFARYEASNFGSPQIEIHHLLLGILREDHTLVNVLFASTNPGYAIRKDIETRFPAGGEKISTSVDLPLGHDAKVALAYASEEAERLNHRSIDSVHLLLGIMRTTLGEKLL